MNTEETIYTEQGEATELSAPADFGNGLAFLNPSEFPDLDEAEVGISIKPEYIEFNAPGDNVRGVFNGVTQITTKDQANPGQYKKIPAIVLQTKDGVKLNAGANLVSQLQTLLPGTAIYINYKGLEATKSGNKVKAYEVRLLNVPRVNLSMLPMIQTPASPALPAPTQKEDEPQDVQMYRYNDSMIVNAVMRATKFTKEEAIHTVYDARKAGKIGEALTIGEAIEFGNNLVNPVPTLL